jgi:hypothetical protein
MRFDDVVDALDEHARDTVGKILDHLGLSFGDLIPSRRTTQETSHIAGRLVIVKEDDYPVSLVDLDGRSVTLNLQKVIQDQTVDGLISGLVCVVEGTNPDGNCFIVDKVHMTATHKPSSKPLANEPTGASICVASGPFGSQANLEAFVDKMKNADVVIVCGKLTEAETMRLQHACSERRISLAIVPHHESEGSSLFVYPQPRNPSLLSISSGEDNKNSGITVGIHSVDLLKILAREEFSLKQNRDRSVSMCNYVLAQGCFFPLYPAPEGSLPFDVTHIERLRFAERPHVLIVPSVVKEFVKYVDGTWCVNPRSMEMRMISWISVKDGSIRVEVERI